MKNLVLASALLTALSAVASEELQFLTTETAKATAFEKNELIALKKKMDAQASKSLTTNYEDLNRLTAFQKAIPLQNENFIAALEQTLIYKFRAALEKLDLTALKADLESDISFSDVSQVGTLKTTDVDGISFATAKEFTEKKGSAQFQETFKNYLGKFKVMEYVDAKILSVTSRDPQSSEIKTFSGFPALLAESKQLNAQVQLELRGIMPNGFRRTDKAVITLNLNNTGKTPVISGLQYNTLHTLQINRQPAFAEVAKNAGFDAGKIYPRLEALRRGGYAFAVEDINNDQQPDAFVGAYGASTLWLGADGKFNEKAMEEVNKVTLAKAAAFVDFDNDGWKDLIVSRFAADNLTGDVLVFKNTEGIFKEVKNAFRSDLLRDYAMPMAIADFNNDGLLDVYIGFPGERDFSVGKATNPKQLANHGLFINKGDFKFTDSTQQLGQNTLGLVAAPHGALASDFNMDGRVDILVMDDQKDLSPLYKNDGNGRFSLQNQKYEMMNKGYGMGVAAGDFNQDGLQDYIMSNATFNTQTRMNFPQKDLARGLRLFMNSAKNKFVETTDLSSLTDTGEAAGGVTVVDYDNDGLQDIYLTNGLWSGSSREDNIDSLFAKATKLGVIKQDHLQDGKGDRSPQASRSLFMKVLMTDTVGTGSSKKTLSFAGYQRNRLFKNLGNNQFIEVGYLEGVDSMSDGYMSVVADINKDGKPDLLLRNCDPGATDNVFAPLQVYQNNHGNAKSITVGLKGTKSNVMGVGAKLFATIGKKIHYREIHANNSAVQGEVVAHFGMGTFDKVKKLKILWPSGRVDVHTNLKPGRHQFEETLTRTLANSGE